jgi:hypothetical protein
MPLESMTDKLSSPWSHKGAHTLGTIADTVDIVLAMLRHMEATLLGLQQLRNYVGQDVGRQMLEVLIEEMESHVAETKRKIKRWDKAR